MGLTLGPRRSPQDLFSIEAFDDDPSNFYAFAHALWPGDAIQPSLTHRFLVALAKQKKLLRVYTQNIDGLEKSAGLPGSLLVECHGSLNTARCRDCRKTCAAAELAEEVAQRAVPHCSCGGVWKPEVTFFGEALAKRVGKKLEEDRENADLLLVMGTSLAVAPISKVMGWLPFQIPQLLINRDAVAPPRSTSDGFDVSLIGNADDVIAHLAHAAGLTIPDPKSAPKTSPKPAASQTVAREPDAVCARGAVWAPASSSDAAAAFVAKATEQLNADAEDEELVETISCDACGEVMGAGDAVWT